MAVDQNIRENKWNNPPNPSLEKANKSSIKKTWLYRLTIVEIEICSYKSISQIIFYDHKLKSPAAKTDKIEIPIWSLWLDGLGGEISTYKCFVIYRHFMLISLLSLLITIAKHKMVCF